MRRSTGPCSTVAEEQGYEVVPVTSGAEAIATLRDRHVDLVLLDVQMPGVNGFKDVRQTQAGARDAIDPIGSSPA